MRLIQNKSTKIVAFIILALLFIMGIFNIIYTSKQLVKIAFILMIFGIIIVTISILQDKKL